MNIKKYENFLTKSIFFFPLIMTLMGILLTSISFFISLKTFQKIEFNHIKHNLLNENKIFLKNNVKNIDEDIKISIKSLINQEKEKSKLDIETISETIDSIYDNYHGKNKKLFISNVLHSVNKIRKRHYFGIIDISTKIMIIHPIKKVLNKDTSKMKLGKYSLYKWVTNTIKNSKQEGYFKVTFYKPNKKKQVTKIVFVKYLKNLNWAIGTGEYLDEILNTIKKDFIKKIVAKKGDFSVIDTKDNRLYAHNYTKIIKNNSFFNKLKKSKNGEFTQNSKQIVYSIFNSDLNLIIQSTIDVEQINRFIQKECKKIKNVYQEFYRILFINIFIIILISTIISIIISKKIKEIFQIYEQLNTDKIQAEYEANHDVLTGAYNRSFFNKRLKDEIITAKLHQKNLSLVLIDIDHFKKINDNYGHQTGDIVLKKLVTFIQNSLREEDFFARWGGEEFVIIFKQINVEDAKKRFEEIKYNLINNLEIQTPVKFTFSAGITQYEMNDNENDLIKKADKALYKAKITRNTITIYKKEL